MKSMSLCKKLFALCMIVSAGSLSYGYSWIYQYVKTDKAQPRLMIKMMLTAKGNARFWYLISPGRKATFDWGFPYCYSRIEIIEYNPMSFASLTPSVRQKLNNLPDGEYGDNSDKDLLRYLDGEIWQTPGIMYAPTTENQAASEAAIQNAIDQSSQAIDKAVTTAASSGAAQETGFGAMLGSVSNAIIKSYSESRCRSRVFNVYKGKWTNPVSQKKENAFVLVATEN